MRKFVHNSQKIASFLLVLILLLPCFAFAEEQPVRLNSLIKADTEQLEVRFLTTPTNAKSDATLVICHGKEELQVIIVDGGLANGCCLLELANLRKSLMESVGLGDQVKNKNYKLAVTLFATHCHRDHVEELCVNILPSSLLTIDALYLPPATALTSDGTYNNAKNGDLKYRPRLFNLMQFYTPNTPIYELEYGQTLELELACGNAKIYAPLEDWGIGDKLKYIENVYYSGGNTLKRKDEVPNVVLNANCEWLHVSLGDYSVLFTGDIMKKKGDRSDEALDLMVNAYKDEVISDIVKYPHHGIARNPAAPIVRDQLLKKGGIAVVTTNGARDAAGRHLEMLKTDYVTTEDGSYTFIIDESGIEYRLEDRQ